MYQSSELNTANGIMFFLYPAVVMYAESRVNDSTLFRIVPLSYLADLIVLSAIFFIMPWETYTASVTMHFADQVIPPSSHFADLIFFAILAITPICVAAVCRWSK
jgi:hypothetical protein